MGPLANAHTSASCAPPQNGAGTTLRLGGRQQRLMTAIAPWLRGLAVPARWALVGATCAGVIGALAGLVVGLFAYAPTAPFAPFELGVPAAIVGGVGGLMVAGGVAVARWLLRSDR